MKHYEITLTNGGYPLVYRCSTIAEAYGCIENLVRRTPGMYIDLSGTMEILVDMRQGNRRRHENHHYAIAVKDGEV